MTDLTEFAAFERDAWADPETPAAQSRDFARASLQCVDPLVRAVARDGGFDALDLCCGPGVVSRELASAGARVTGVDFSRPMLEMARSAAPEIEFVQGDAGALAFDAGSFDAAAIGFGIPHVPDPERVFREAKRVLRHLGRFAFSVWRRPEGATGFGIVFSAISEHGDPSAVLPPGPDAHAYADSETAFAALGAAGFIEPAIETVDSFWTVDDPGAPFDYFREGTVRGALLLRRQPPGFSDAIRAAVVEAVRDAYGPRGPWRMPVPAVVISATA